MNLFWKLIFFFSVFEQLVSRCIYECKPGQDPGDEALLDDEDLEGADDDEGFGDWQDTYQKTAGLQEEDFKTRMAAIYAKIPKGNPDFVTRDELEKYAKTVADESHLTHSEREFKNLDKDNDGFVSFEEMNALYVNSDNQGENSGESTPDSTLNVDLKYSQARFEIIDVDKNRLLSLQEIRALLNPGALEPLLNIETKAVMEIQDKNKDGFIDFNEYTESGDMQIPEEDLGSMKADFDTYDRDKDGKISSDEIKHVIINIHQIEITKGVDEIFKAVSIGLESPTEKVTLTDFTNPATGIGISVITGGGDILRNPENYANLNLPFKNVKVDYPSFDNLGNLDTAGMEDMLKSNSGDEKLADLLKQFEAQQKPAAAQETREEL